jgi:tetratricopeptide (TPR) repeat protein
MPTKFIPASLLRVLMMVSVLCVPAAFSQEIAPDDSTNYAKEMPAAYVTSSHQILAYNRAIKETESREGAYGSSLSESLLGLALILQSQGRHDEAIKLFKRGAHLARINEGLYCAQQIPFVRGEIASQKEQQNYAQADQRHNYLHHVQTKSIGSGDPLADAYMEYAQWQYDAYQLGMEEKNYTRLIDMWELYRMAFNDVVSREGKTSPNLLPPLHGMLQTQYLISSYVIPLSTPVFGEEGQIDEALLRFKTYHNQSYQQGNAIIQAIAGIEQERTAPDSPNHARVLVMLGDWRLWNGKNTAALEAYREAETELARTGDAQAETQQLFGTPVALPDIAEMSLLPPEVEPNESAVTLAFGVTEYGRVQDVERLDNNEEDDTQAFRLMRQLRKITFRPRFEAGQPVETEKLVKAFQIQ